MSAELLKYPKTFHHRSSKPNFHGNDRVHENADHLVGKEVIITTKLDGEGTGMTKDVVHARSLDSSDHPSRHWIKAKHAEIKHLIPEGYKVFGENVCGLHSVKYTNLPTFFFMFGIYDENNICLSWNETKMWANELGLMYVPVLYEGVWSEEAFMNCYTGRTIIDGVDTGAQEGVVARVRDSFPVDQFTWSVIKFVSAGFKVGNDHWSKLFIQNEMKR